jgi:peptidoglycan-associated lipoprotein
MRNSLVLIVCILMALSCSKKVIIATPEAYKIDKTIVKAEHVKPAEAVEVEPVIKREVLRQYGAFLFDFDKFDVLPKYQSILKHAAKYIADNNFNVTINGHCDSRGTDEYNDMLGAKRAEAVRDYIVSCGVLVDRVQTWSFGKRNLLSTCKTDQCHAENRRVEIEIINKE